MNYWERRDAAKVNEGAGIEVEIAEYPGWRFQIGRDCAWNKDLARALARIAQQPKYRRLIERMSAPDYVTNDEDAAIDWEFTCQSWVEGLLLGWSGVVDRKGKPLPFNTLNACALFHQFPDIYTALQREAKNKERFEKVTNAEKQETASGNSEAA